LLVLLLTAPKLLLSLNTVGHAAGLPVRPYPTVVSVIVIVCVAVITPSIIVTVIPVINTNYIAVSGIITAGCISQPGGIIAVNSCTAVTVAYAVTGVSIAVGTGINYPGGAGIISTPNGRAVNVKRVIAYVLPVWAVYVIDIVNLHPVTGYPFYIIRTRTGHIPAIIAGIKVVNNSGTPEK
jgi:hypothetical protein